MKNHLVILIFPLLVQTGLFAQSDTPAAGEKVKISFQKNPVTVREGESQMIRIELKGILPKDDDVVELTLSVTESDATINKDFKIKGEKSFVFKKSEEKEQFRYLEIEALKDDNQENERFSLELKIVKGETLSELDVSKCVVKIEDFKTETEQVVDELVRRINEDKETSEIMGTIRILDNTPKLFTMKDTTKDSKGYDDKPDNRQKTGESIKISKVELQFEYGIATEIRAFQEGNLEVFSNHSNFQRKKTRPRYGVSMRHNAMSKRFTNYYLNGEREPWKSIKLSDLLGYNHGTGLNFVPDDKKIVLEPDSDKEKEDLYVKTSLNSYIQFNIYTDLLSVLRVDQGNGIIQSDASAKIYFTTLPAKNKIQFLFNYVMPYVKLARYESGFQYVPNTSHTSFGLGGNGKLDSVDRMLLNQRKFLDVGLKLNIINRIGKFGNAYEWNVFSGFGWFKRQGPIDNIQTQVSGSTKYLGWLTNTYEWGTEFRASLLQYKNFGINLGVMATNQKIINATQNKIGDGKFKPFYRTEAEIFYYPIEKSSDKIFLRTYNTFNFSSKEESFLRIQVGYKAQFKISNNRKG